MATGDFITQRYVAACADRGENLGFSPVGLNVDHRLRDLERRPQKWITRPQPMALVAK